MDEGQRNNQDDKLDGKFHGHILQNSRWLSFSLYLSTCSSLMFAPSSLFEPPCLSLLILTNFVACCAGCLLLLLLLTMRALGGRDEPPVNMTPEQNTIQPPGDRVFLS